MNKQKEHADPVRVSRAGDAFHYRWAARRCLRMVNPISRLTGINIEGSRKSDLSGELVIDVAEYYESDEQASSEVAYYQLKHSTKRLDKHFTLSDLRRTIEGFGDRFRGHREQGALQQDLKYTILTNRPVSKTFKDSVRGLANGKGVAKQFLRTIASYTKLEGDGLSEFCGRLKIEDGEGNYLEQRYSLHAELARIFVGAVEDSEIDTLLALVNERALPGNSGAITPQDVLSRIGCSSEHLLFPAIPTLELIEKPIDRSQYAELVETVSRSEKPVVVHAESGVGKSIFAQHLARNQPPGSLAIVYDCFGSGKYRSRSEPRHRARDALVQIANEIASLGLCEFMIPRDTDRDDAFLRGLLTRSRKAVANLRVGHPDACITIVLDAADNAEMAAEEVNESCFANQLLRETMPSGVKLLALCRTERIEDLKLLSSVEKKPLKPFNSVESAAHVRSRFPSVSEVEAEEFHRLTGGNPRVQANALEMSGGDFSEVLENLGPNPVSVNLQIESQLHSAIERLKDSLPTYHQSQIDSICLGLANLPPFIPLDVLALAANVEVAAIKSFVADLGRPLWISDLAVQFRDEPTETWFKTNFGANTKQIGEYVESIRKLAESNPYVALALPALLLQAEQYEELVELALSDRLLPKDRPIDARNIRLFRLQFAFRAALKQKNLVDACKLAMLAGEEAAGDERQFELLRKNLDLVAPLQSPQRVQDLAHKRLISGGWRGSESVYSASLLSSIPDFRGEALGYLRSASNWLDLYFEQQEHLRDEDFALRYENQLDDQELVELSFTRYRLFGSAELAKFVMSWTPISAVARIAKEFARRLVDAADFEALSETVANASTEDPGSYLSFSLAVNEQLWLVGRSIPTKSLRKCVDLLLEDDLNYSDRSGGIRREENLFVPSLAEACVSRRISRKKVRAVLKKYVLRAADYSVRSEYEHVNRYQYLRSIALECVLSNKRDLKIEDLLPQDWLSTESKKHDSRELSSFRHLIGGALRWHIVRADVIAGNPIDLETEAKLASEKTENSGNRYWGRGDTLPFEISKVKVARLAMQNSPSADEIESVIRLVSDADSKVWFGDLLELLRFSHRADLSNAFRDEIEGRCSTWISNYKDLGPAEKAEHYISLARAVLPNNKNDAIAYFDKAIEVVSQFGEEMVERWNAVESLAQKYSEAEPRSSQFAFRFIRCAELIGDRVVKEKYIDRDGALKTCAVISPQQGIAALSRWRDRDIGDFDRQLLALSKVLIEQCVVSPAAAWALTGFQVCRKDSRHALYVLENEHNAELRLAGFEQAAKDMLVEGSSIDNMKALLKVSSKAGLRVEDDQPRMLADAIEFEMSQASNQHRAELLGKAANSRDDSEIDWHSIFSGLDLESVDDVSNLIDRFDEMDAPRYPEPFWAEVYRRLTKDSAYRFLEALFEIENADAYDLESSIECLPKAWKRSQAISRLLPKLAQRLTQRFAPEYCNPYRIARLISCFGEVIGRDELVLSVVDGLSDLSFFLSASSFFAFVESVVRLLEPVDSADVLDFALSRFEMHIDLDFGDGVWRPEMDTESITVSSAVAEFLWSALASPSSSVRWEATHSVRRLVEAGGGDEVDSLIRLLSGSKRGPFSSVQYPFYDLHAKLYLLIALSRVSMEHSNLLAAHSEAFACLALDRPPHALIRKIAASIALTIERAIPATYSNARKTLLENVGNSEFPSRKKSEELLVSPWHESGSVDTSIDFLTSYNFDEYWLDPLSRVFGIAGKQVQDLVKETIVKEWGVEPTTRFIDDPRSEMWRSRRHEGETWSSSGSYPSTDDYQFYLSYHAMLAVADRVHQAMPVVASEWSDSEWEDWLSRHEITRSDGRWVADRRDVPPLERKASLDGSRSDDWRWEILPTDFLTSLVREKNGHTWLNCYGSWNECESDRSERLTICSALVTPESSKALLAALSTCINPHDFRLPCYGEASMEFRSPGFELLGWVDEVHHEIRVDESDPHTGDIRYPPATVGGGFISLMKLSVDRECRFWSVGGVAVLQNEIWGDGKPSESDEFVRRGNRMSGSLSFLKKLCMTTGKAMLFEIQIERSLSDSYARRGKDDIGYTPSYSKIYLLTGDGALRDIRTSYQLREAIS